MKAIQLKNGFGFEELTLTELDQPTPGPKEVLIRMRAASLNYRDLVVLSGLMPIEVKFPFIPLSDGAGEIVAIGQGVTRFQVGHRVAGNFQQRFIGGNPRPGVWPIMVYIRSSTVYSLWIELEKHSRSWLKESNIWVKS